jgi:hypothetical protein
MDDRTNTFNEDFYIQRRVFANDDPKDSDLCKHTPLSDYLLKRIVTRVTFGSPAEMPIHAASMHRKEKLIDLYGPEALAGRPAAFQPIPVNGTHRIAEPLILNVLNDRIALMQEMTTGLVTRTPSEIELLTELHNKGYIHPAGEEGEPVG